MDQRFEGDLPGRIQVVVADADREPAHGGSPAGAAADVGRRHGVRDRDGSLSAGQRREQVPVPAPPRRLMCERPRSGRSGPRPGWRRGTRGAADDPAGLDRQVDREWCPPRRHDQGRAPPGHSPPRDRRTRRTSTGPGRDARSRASASPLERTEDRLQLDDRGDLGTPACASGWPRRWPWPRPAARAHVAERQAAPLAGRVLPGEPFGRLELVGRLGALVGSRPASQARTRPAIRGGSRPRSLDPRRPPAGRGSGA